MAACVASGTTTVENASIEPETMDLIKLLKNLGANIEVDKPKKKIKVTGKNIENYGCTASHTVIPDRIVAGTYAIAAAITGFTLYFFILQLFTFPKRVL